MDTNDNKCETGGKGAPKIQVTSGDTASLKSETSSLSRPLKFAGASAEDMSDGHTDKSDKQPMSNVYNPCEVRTDGTIETLRSNRFPTLVSCKNDSTEEKTVCCNALALNLYTKALESAKKALPTGKSKHRSQFPRSFGEDFESIGPEGFNYLDDGQTECSYDYRDIEFNRDSMFRPDVLATNLDEPISVNRPLSEEPTNLSELQAKYGLPEEADRVQPYKPPNSVKEQSVDKKPIKKSDKKSDLKKEVAINKDSDTTTDKSDPNTNTIEEGIIIKDRSGVTNYNPHVELTNVVQVYREGFDDYNPPPKTSVTPVKTSLPSVQSVKPSSDKTEPISSKIVELDDKTIPEISVDPCDTPISGVDRDMDLLAKRTSQMIIENAFESIAKSNSLPKNADKPTKKSSADSSLKQMDKKEKKMLEKRLKEEEKNRKQMEKLSKDMERKERKKLFDRFRSEDKQKKKIQKKTKEFEKLKRKMSEKKPKDDNPVKSDAEADMEADDEDEPPEPVVDRPYEDIDEPELTPEQRQTRVMTVVNPTDKPMATDVVKYEFIENVREIGVTYVPSDDGNDSSQATDKSKSKSSSFRMPRIESFKSKITNIFPKRTPKIERKADVKPNETQKPDDMTGEKSSIGNVPEIVVDSGNGQSKAVPEYENVDQSGVEMMTDTEHTTVNINDVMLSPWETEDEDRQQFLERVSRVESPKSAKKRKKSKTRARLDRFRAKALDSLPKISGIMPKVKDLVIGRGAKETDTRTYGDLEYERFVSDQSILRQRYDSDFDCVSDSELCDSLRRKTGAGGMARHHVYEEMAATQERLDAYMSPVSGPLRPPRRFPSLKSTTKVSSVPTLATQEIIRVKRIPPPRPPPPRPPLPRAPVLTITVDSKTNSLTRRRPKQKVPPEIYYNNLRLNYKPRRRFIAMNSMPNHLNAMSTYDEPKPPLPVIVGQHRPTIRVMRTQSMQKVEHKNAINAAKNQIYRSNTMPFKERFLSNTPVAVNAKVGPTPPPRRKRKASAHRSETDDPLNWRPFTWKTRRCRSLTELDVRKKRDLSASRAPNYENIPPKPLAPKSPGSRPRTPKPNRPPLPKCYYSSYSLHSSKRNISENYHIYAAISRKGHINGHPNAGRPLPPPPVPPRPKCISTKPLSPSSPVPQTRDVSVSTKDNGLLQMCEKQTQLDARNHSICEVLIGPDVNGNELDIDLDATPTNPLTPTTPTNQLPIAFCQTVDNRYEEPQLAAQCQGINDSTGTLSSVATTTNWFDAENPSEMNVHPYQDYDQDTLNDDISSIASNYMSCRSDVTVTEDRDSPDREQTPVPEPSHHSDVPRRSAPKAAMRSQSTRIVTTPAPERPLARRSLPSNPNDDSADSLGMTRELHSELKQILENRVSDHSSDRPESMTSSEASIHEIIMTNIESSSDSAGNQSYLWSTPRPVRRSESVDSLDSQPIDSSSDGDDYSLSSANEQSHEYHKRKQNQKLYFIAKELYSSEEVFIDVLRLLNVDFRKAVEEHIPEEVLLSILKYLPQLQSINEQLVTDLKTRIDDWPNHQRISDVLVKICPFLKQYSQYIRDFETISANYDKALERFPGFVAAVKAFEATARCQKLSVKHFMLKPVQRIPQYRLLLDDYLKHLNPDSDDFLDTCKALEIVSEVANHANNSMKSNENLSKLLQIQNSIIGGTEVIKPGRVFVKEGELMKLSRKGMQERWFILFNDCLMYLTAVQNGVYRVNHELSLTGMRVSLPTQQDFQNEFSVISHTRSFSLAASSPKEREKWVEVLRKAIEDNINKRISFAKSGSICSDETEPALMLGTCAPVWIPDARVTMCQLCTESFSVTFRRHHCRCCGKVVCSACSQNKAPLPYLRNRTARVCDECFDKLTEHLERLDSRLSGSSGEVAASASDTDEGWTLKEWRQQFARNLVRKSNRKPKHKLIPAVLKEVSANDVGSLISGYLHKREAKRHWKRYWFVIKELVLYTYKASEDVAALTSMPLLGYKVETLLQSVDGIDPKSLFQLSHPGQPTLLFRAETIGSADRWYKAMQTATTLQ